MKARLISVFLALAALGVVALQTGQATAGGPLVNWWPRSLAAQNIIQTGVDWKNGRFDLVRTAGCIGIGPTYEQTLYHHFWCTVVPRDAGKHPYAVTLWPMSKTATAITDTTVNWDAPLVSNPWRWDTQDIANLLYTRGISWPKRRDEITRDVCQGFGQSSHGQYGHFYCYVSTIGEGDYGVVVSLPTKTTYHVTWAGDNQAIELTAGSSSSKQTGRSQPGYTDNTGGLAAIQAQQFWINQAKFGESYPPLLLPP